LAEMRPFFCSECGAESEVDEAEGRQRRKICAICKDIERREAALLREWEVARGYAE